MNPAIEAGFTMLAGAVNLLMKPVPDESFSCFRLQCARDKGNRGRAGTIR